MRLIAAFFALLLLAACSNQVPTSVPFSHEDSDALLVFGSSTVIAQTFTITFSKYDLENLRLDSNHFSGMHHVRHKATGPAVQYHVIKVPPGRYVLKNVTTYGPNETNIFCLSKGTFRFDLEPGQIVYVGNITFGVHRVMQAGFDMPAAKEALLNYPNVKGEILRGTLTDATFRNGTDLLGTTEACGGYHVGELKASEAASE